MFDWVLNNTPSFTIIFSYRKRSEWKDKQSSDILLSGTQKIFRQQKRGPVLDDNYESNGSIPLKLI